ncbi:MAG: hypothetical protein K8H85_16495 [Cyclobacteriaceae bacterium]|nr:hypothetical protein [Cyclobacteriaceae bacterium]
MPKNTFIPHRRKLIFSCHFSNPGNTLVLITVMGVTLISCHESGKAAITQPLSQEELIKRGAYLVNTSACHDCHSPKVMTPMGPEPDPKRLLSGYPGNTPLPVIKKEVLNDWVLFNQELTSAVGTYKFPLVQSKN